MATAPQRTFDRTLADARHRPTVGMDGAKHLLDLGEDEILVLIESLQLTPAWNIGLGGERREIRLLRKSIDRFIVLPEPVRKNNPLSEAEIMRLLLPPAHAKPYLSNREVQRILNCVSGHVLNLVDAGQLAEQPGTKYTRGPSGSALITVESFTAFLAARRLA